jgi:hypothetical protein
MTKNDLTHIVVVLDRSGSMASVRTDTIGGFNTFLEQQQKLPGTATMTLIQFDHEYLVVHKAMNVRGLAPLTEETYVPRGQTALYDALGRAVAEATEFVNAMPAEKRPGVVVAILTDGAENASREFTHTAVQTLIKERTAAGWEFLFLGANIDVVQEAARIGIGAASAVAFKSSGEGTRGAFGAMSKRVSSSRRSRSSDGSDPSGPKKIH